MPMGPLNGVTVVEFAGLGPAPFTGMMLADMGARVVRIDRAGSKKERADHGDVLSRGRESLTLDLKHPSGKELALAWVDRADVVLEGFRPGVMESLGLGPDDCLARNPRLVYGRMTGWGQSGPLAQAAGHDINYTALSGALHSSARRGAPPTPTPGLVGDFGGGGMLLAFGVVCAVLEASRSGKGQVVDAAITDGSALLASLIYGWKATGRWHGEAGTNVGDGGPFFYDVYACADGRYVSLGAIEPKFYGLFRERCGLTDSDFDAQWDEQRWPELKERLARLFASKTRDEWCALLEGSDACFAPVLDLEEAPRHPHNLARETFVSVDGITQPAPAPRFGRTPVPPCHSVPPVGQHNGSLLAEIGLSDAQIAELEASGVL